MIVAPVSMSESGLRGHIYIAQPPLYQIKRKKREEYVDDDSQLLSSGECMRLFCPKRTSSVVFVPPSPSWFNQFGNLKGLSLIKGLF
jgi:DNA gyrase/topoisomerase IV subunit B